MASLLPKKWYLWYIYHIFFKLRGKCLHFKRGCGYYIPVGYIGVNPIGRIIDQEMVSGVTLSAKLVSYKTFRDPDDMIESSIWEILGFTGKKAIRDCNYKEFLDIYGDYFTEHHI